LFFRNYLAFMLLHPIGEHTTNEPYARISGG
jgi:hypothetical protein